MKSNGYSCVLTLSPLLTFPAFTIQAISKKLLVLRL
jgi:hypothetical protein